MKFNYGKNDFKSFKSGNEHCYLLTNGLGGFSSTTLINSLARNDHSLFMACTKAPNNRKNIISKVEEILRIDNKEVHLSSQEYVCYTKNIAGFHNIHSFSQEYLPKWTYFYDGVEIIKTIVYEQGKNTLGIKYSINNRNDKDVKLEVIPVFVFAKRGEILSSPHNYTIKNDTFIANDIELNIHSNYSSKELSTPTFINDYYFAYDAVDGRNAVGSGTTLVSYYFECKKPI